MAMMVGLKLGMLDTISTHPAIRFLAQIRSLLEDGLESKYIPLGN